MKMVKIEIQLTAEAEPLSASHLRCRQNRSMQAA